MHLVVILFNLQYSAEPESFSFLSIKLSMFNMEGCVKTTLF